MNGYRHYIRIDSNNVITYGYSDAFEQMQQGDIQLSGEFGRHFQIYLLTNRGQYLYKLVDGKMVQRTQEDLDIEWSSKPTPAPTDPDKIKALEDAVLDLMLGGLQYE